MTQKILVVNRIILMFDKYINDNVKLFVLGHMVSCLVDITAHIKVAIRADLQPLLYIKKFTLKILFSS